LQREPVMALAPRYRVYVSENVRSTTAGI